VVTQITFEKGLTWSKTPQPRHTLLDINTERLIGARNIVTSYTLSKGHTRVIHSLNVGGCHLGLISLT